MVGQSQNQAKSQSQSQARPYLESRNGCPLGGSPSDQRSSGSSSSTSMSHQLEPKAGQRPAAKQSKISSNNAGQLLWPPARRQQAATSDYWSTTTTATFTKSLAAEPSPGGLAMPALEADEYYLEVTQAAQQQQQLEMDSGLLMDKASSLSPALLAPSSFSPMDEDYADYAVPSDESCCRLDRSQVELVQLIGEGQKGYVFLGKLQSRDGRQMIDVAIKTLKYETEQLIERLMSEAAMMRQLEHPHIIRFIGVCPETPALIAMELAQFGELKQYLKLNRLQIRVSQLVLFAFQISTALSYLESKQYVHRDVAARNVLVCSHQCVKLADFGLSRNLQPIGAPRARASEASRRPVDLLRLTTATDKQEGGGNMINNKLSDKQQLIDTDDRSHYVAAPRVKLPVRWLAPESLVFRRFTSASDVWMFAVCAWELFHFGGLRPWPQLRNNQVLMAIEQGQRLGRPANCPAHLYQLMLQCWSYAPIQRPKFREIKQCLWSIYLNERTREQLELERLEQQRQRFRVVQQRDSQASSSRRHLLSGGQRLCQRLMSASPLASANYAMSNYSTSATTTTEQSANEAEQSSPSSSMGTSSLLRRARRPREADERRLAAQMGRFRSGTHLLQKQRSQGAIGDAGPQEPVVVAPSGRQFGLDDGPLSRRDWQRRRQLDGIESDEDDDDDDREQDEEDSGEGNERLQVQPPQARQLRATPKRPLVEPAYEGLFDPSQISMLRPSSELAAARPASWREGNNQLLVSPNSQARGPTPRRSPPERQQQVERGQLNETTKSTQTKRPERDQLGQVLQALRITPMKAKLGSPQEQTVKVFSRESVAREEEKEEEAEDERLSSQEVAERQRLQARGRQEGLSKMAEEERPAQSQLQLHQRLLGRIRPTSSSQLANQRAERQNRRSANLQMSQSSEQAVETVDESLQLLESLMRGAPSGSSESVRPVTSQQQQQDQPVSRWPLRLVDPRTRRK